MANNGYIKLYRSITEWQHWGEPIVFQLFVYLLIKANRTDSWWRGRECKTGETFTTIQEMAEECKSSKHTIINALKKLEESGEIVRTKYDQYNIKTTIINYSSYQCGRGASTAPPTAPPTAPRNENTPYIYLNKNREEREEGKTTHNDVPKIVEDILENNKISLEGFCKSQGIDEATLRKLLTQVITEWQFIGYEFGGHESKQRLLHALQRKAADLRRDGQLVGDERERKAKFIAECRELVNKGYKRDEVLRFAEYYTQQERGTKRMLFEAERAWNTETRFKRWNRN